MLSLDDFVPTSGMVTPSKSDIIRTWINFILPRTLVIRQSFLCTFVTGSLDHASPPWILMDFAQRPPEQKERSYECLEVFWRKPFHYWGHGMLGGFFELWILNVYSHLSSRIRTFLQRRRLLNSPRSYSRRKVCRQQWREGSLRHLHERLPEAEKQCMSGFKLTSDQLFWVESFLSSSTNFKSPAWLLILQVPPRQQSYGHCGVQTHPEWHPGIRWGRIHKLRNTYCVKDICRYWSQTFKLQDDVFTSLRLDG